MKPITFRLYPEGRYRYCLVKVWPNHRTMVPYLMGLHPARRGEYRSTQGLHTSTERWKHAGDRLRKSGIFGELNLHRGRIDTEIASHEIAHAGIAWARRVRINPISPSGQQWESADNERFCYAMGRMMAQFSNHAHRLKLWSA